MTTTAPWEVYSIPGAAKYNNVTIATGIPTGSDAAYLGYTTVAPSHPYDFPDPANCTFVALNIVAGNPMALTNLTSLTAGMRYWAGVSTTNSGTIVWRGNPIRFHTRYNSISGESVSVNWAYGSCQFNHANNPEDGAGTKIEHAWDDLGGPNEFQINDILWDTGDFHYQGGQVLNSDTDWKSWGALYWDQLHYLPIMRRARALMAEDQISDDHEYRVNNGDSDNPPDPNQPNDAFNRGLARLHQMAASEKLFAMYSLEDDSKGMYGTYMLTPHVRVIILDCVSLKRTWSKAPGTLTLLGTAQFNWLKDVLTPPQQGDIPTLNLIIASKAYIGNNWNPANHSDDENDNNRDKVWWYHDWRSDFKSFLSTLTSKQVNVAWLGGDRHWCCWDSGSNNAWGGFPCLVGSGWSQTNLDLVDGEVYLHMVPPPTTPHGTQVYQYLCGTITDHSSGNVDFATTIRYWNGTQMTSLSTTTPMNLSFNNPN